MTRTAKHAALAATLITTYGNSRHIGARLRGLAASLIDGSAHDPTTVLLLVTIDLLFVLVGRGPLSAGPDLDNLRALASAASAEHAEAIKVGLQAAAIDTSRALVAGVEVDPRFFGSELRLVVRRAQDDHEGPLGAVQVAFRALALHARVREALAGASGPGDVDVFIPAQAAPQRPRGARGGQRREAPAAVVAQA